MNDTSKLGVRGRPRPVSERFWEKVKIGKPDECWDWQGCRNRKGYGNFFWKKASQKAHRIAYELTKGIIESNQYCRHKCGNIGCCNPGHLYLTTENNDIGDRFWPKIRKGKPDECWPWMASKLIAGGYGQFALRGAPVRAHRLAFALTKGEIPKDKYVCHACDNPACCNPSHLFLGTNSENIKDCIKKGRFITVKRIANLRRKLAAEQVHKIRELSEHKTQRELGKMFNVGHATIGCILRNITWTHLK
jgi:hypothetical protein